MKKIKDALSNVSKRQWLILAYLPIHFGWFFIMEAVNVKDYIVIYSKLDDLIPFCEWFVFPYLIWFLFMLVPGLYFLVKDKEDFEKYMLSLFIGLFISMSIISIWPSGQDLRVEVDASKNFPSWVVAFIYNFDTNTNVFPSMHVVGATAVAFCVSRSNSLRGRKLLKAFCWILGITIIMATVFLKQHSVLDVFAGLIIEAVALAVVYSGAASKLLDKLLGEGKSDIKK